MLGPRDRFGACTGDVTYFATDAVRWCDAEMGKCKFADSWLEKDEFKQWLKPVVENNREAYCTYCKKKISVASMGINAVKSHMDGASHKAVVLIAIYIIHQVVMLCLLFKLCLWTDECCSLWIKVYFNKPCLWFNLFFRALFVTSLSEFCCMVVLYRFICKLQLFIKLKVCCWLELEVAMRS